MGKKTVFAFLLTFVFISGCTIIAGREDSETNQGLTYRFVETLRNEASLRGESLKDIAFNTDPKTTLQQPNSVFADAFRVYVTDANPARVFIFDRGERTVSILDGTPPPAEDEVKLIAPAGITVDSTGLVYVSDSQQGRVFGFNRNGKLFYVLGKTGELGSPTGLATDPRKGLLYVADTHAHQVKVFNALGERVFIDDSTGHRLDYIGGSGKPEEDFKFPGAVTFDRNGNLYVLDTARKRVYIYDPDAKFIKSFSLSGSMPGYAIKPKGLAVDSTGHLYVTDSVSNNIIVFDHDGIFLFTWGRTGSMRGDFWTPSGIFIDSQDQIYIADQTNGRIQIFQYMK